MLVNQVQGSAAVLDIRLKGRNGVKVGPLMTQHGFRLLVWPRSTSVAVWKYIGRSRVWCPSEVIPVWESEEDHGET